MGIKRGREMGEGRRSTSIKLCGPVHLAESRNLWESLEAVPLRRVVRGLFFSPCFVACSFQARAKDSIWTTVVNIIVVNFTTTILFSSSISPPPSLPSLLLLSS